MRSTEKLALRVLRSVLPQAQLRPTSDERADVLLELPPGLSIPIQLKWAGAGFPRDVERALVGVRRGGGAPAVVVAKELSPGARELLDREGINWLTEGGAARLNLGSIIIDRETDALQSSQKLQRDELRWTPAIAAIAEALLDAYVRSKFDHVPSTTILASRSGRSLGSVSAALQQFDREGWTQPPPVSRGPSARRRILQPQLMLDSWSQWANFYERPIRYHSAQRDPIQTARLLQKTFGSAAAFGGRFAADFVAPFSSNVRTVRCYLSDELDAVDREQALASIGFARSDESNRVEVLDAPRNVISGAQERDGYWLVSPIRIYKDLLRDGVRGEDAAQHLRDVAIGF